MPIVHSMVTSAIRVLFGLICRIDADQLQRVPQAGPLIIVANHINSLEAPIIYTQLYPRPMTAFAKAETWEQPLVGRLARLWGAIPLHRGEADAEAFRHGLRALEDGKILIIAPEGTRSGHGRLQRGLPGVVLLALRSKAPLMPMAYYGGEKFQSNLRRLRRTDFHVAIGEPFMLNPGEGRVTRELRQELADALMYRIAALLPEAYRGVYGGEPGRLSALTKSIQLS